MRLESRQLRIVAEIADAGTMTRAAQRLQVTQSALSHQLREVERQVREPLFVRGNRRMIPTEVGERVLAAARRVLHELDLLERELGEAVATGGSGVIRLATECYTCYHWLPRLLAAYARTWPAVSVRIVPEVTADPVAALQEGALDVAIVPEGSDTRRHRVTPLFEDELVVVVAPGHPLARRAWIEPAALEHEHLILYVTATESRLVADVLRPAGVVPRRITRVQLTEAIIELVKAGMGVSAFARWAVAPQLRDGSLVAVRIGRGGVHRRWNALTRSDTDLRPYQKGLIDLLARELRGGPSLVAPARRVAGGGRRRVHEGRA